MVVHSVPVNVYKICAGRKRLSKQKKTMIMIKR